MTHCPDRKKRVNRRENIVSGIRELEVVVHEGAPRPPILDDAEGEGENIAAA